MIVQIFIKRNPRKTSKWIAELVNNMGEIERTVKFGEYGAEDYTIH
jgi:hypothetical protein